MRDSGEAPIPGIAVSNGRQVVLSGVDGRYRLPRRPGAFASLTCPDDGRCDVSYRRDSGDFAVAPDPQPDDFFFVQISDLHGYPVPEDLRELPSPEDIPWWMPRYAVGWYLLRTLGRMYPESEKDEIVEVLREAVAPHRDVSGAWGPTVALEYFDAAMESETEMIDPDGGLRAALAEVEALKPSFVVNTGDFILDGNEVGPEVAASWFDYYASLIADLDVPIYTTMGNNELVGTERDDVDASDPRYGKGLFRSLRGPTHFSFDRGRLHFVALDTHRLEEEGPFAGEWVFGRMEPGIREWLEADLRATSRSAVVVLNHEPFHESPGWNLIGGPIGDDEGVFDAHRVSYALSGPRPQERSGAPGAHDPHHDRVALGLSLGASRLFRPARLSTPLRQGGTPLFGLQASRRACPGLRESAGRPATAIRAARPRWIRRRSRERSRSWSWLRTPEGPTPRSDSA